MADIDRIERELRAGLEGVTSGPWGAGHGWVFTDPASGSPREPLRNILRDVPEAEIQANCDYIAAVQPENIRLLLDELSRRSEALGTIAKELDEFPGSWTKIGLIKAIKLYKGIAARALLQGESNG